MRCSVRAKRRCSQWPPRRMARSTWAPATEGASIGSGRDSRLKCSGPRRIPVCSRSPSTLKAFSMRPPRPTARCGRSKTDRPANTTTPRQPTSGRWRPPPMAPCLSGPATAAASTAPRPPGRASFGTKLDNRTSPALPSTRRAACWPAASPTASCTASRRRIRRLCFTTLRSPKSARSCARPMARCTWPHSVDRWRASRRKGRKPRLHPLPRWAW